MKEFRVLILTNSASDLSKLEFPDFRILNTNSEEFQDFVTKTKVPEYSFMYSIAEYFEMDGKLLTNLHLTSIYGVHKAEI